MTGRQQSSYSQLSRRVVSGSLIRTLGSTAHISHHITFHDKGSSANWCYYVDLYSPNNQWMPWQWTIHIRLVGCVVLIYGRNNVIHIFLLTSLNILYLVIHYKLLIEVQIFLQMKLIMEKPERLENSSWCYLELNGQRKSIVKRKCRAK